MKGRILALGALLALCALLLTACGRDGVKSEKEIMADVEEKRAMDVIAVSDLPIEEVSSLKVLKRQTNKELKNDFVYVTVEADTETAHFVRSMKLTYNYYDDQGWVLDEYEPYAEGENSTKPLKGPDNAVVDDFFAAVHDKFKGFPKTKYASWSVEGMDTDLENADHFNSIDTCIMWAALWVMEGKLYDGMHIVIQSPEPEVIKEYVTYDSLLEDLWKTLTDVSMNPDTEEMEEDWFIFSKGTNREDIWDWFDEQHSKGIGWIMENIED